MAELETSYRELRVALEQIRADLRRWAAESRIGGWSTHQVEPMRQRADWIDEVLERNRAHPAPEATHG